MRFNSFKTGLAASTVCNLAAQVAGFAVLILFTSYFGAGHRTDVLLYVSGSIALVAGFITSLNGAVMIPEYMRLNAREGSARAMSFVNGWMLVCVLLAAVISISLCLFPETILRKASRFDAETITAGQGILILLAPSLLGEVAMASMMEILSANRYFTLPMFTALVNRAAQLVGMMLLHEEMGVQSMAVGTILSYAITVPALALLLSQLLKWDFGTARWRGFGRAWKNAGIASIGNLLTSLANLVPLYMITGLGPGVVSAMNYAQRLLNIPQVLLVSQVSSLTGIKLNEVHARKEFDKVDSVFQRSACGLVFLLTPVAALIFLEAPSIIGVLLRRGSFDEKAVSTSAMFLRYMALSLPLLGVNAITARLFMSAQKIKAGVWFQTLQNFILVIAMYIGVRHYGARGYLCVLTGFYLWHTMAIFPLLRVAFPRVRYASTLAHVVKVATVCGVIAGLAWLLESAIGPLSPTASLAMGAGVFAVLLPVASNWLNLNDDWRDLVSSVRRRLTSGSSRGGE